MKAQIELPPKLIPLFAKPADYRVSWGGRGSGKTRTFAKMTAVRAYQWAMKGDEGTIVCGREFMNSLAESSFAEVEAAIKSEPWLLDHFDLGETYIRTKDHLPGRIDYSFIGLRRNLDSVKSKAKIKLLWVDEADPVTDTAWEKVIPSVREEDSEIWVTWNPERKNSATHKRFRLDPPDRCLGVEMNWRDNPWFPAILQRKRLADQEKRPDSYDHVWEGDFVGLVEGAYFVKQLIAARAKGQIGEVHADPLMRIRAYWDIGGTGNNADAVSIWITQSIGPRVLVLNYYEAVGQDLATHVNWLRDNGYGKAVCILPHDGKTHDKVFPVTYESELKKAGFDVEVVPNMGRGAALKRIEAVRRLFPNIWFNEATTQGGLEALGAYHEKQDEVRGIGLGPNHNWASHGADSFGLMAVHQETPQETGWGTLTRQRTRVV
ncbi:phage terminase large subunit [Sphingomonas sp. LY29]|uniref:PBSX family phage terminase large subunit n=1 Tax=Sphingomonas sp. LY29 TaxID=3095341 RepID=UPI002D779303|nr:phage terminase large subunit [Sphingomonas sp. LY29]WRP25644.1 phage terminase large subunit [Sphingomonas sp. LY29]